MWHKRLSGCFSMGLIFVFPSISQWCVIMRRRQLYSAQPPKFLCSNFEHEISIRFAWWPLDTNMEDHLQHPTLVQLLSCFRRKRFSTDWRVLAQPIVVRQCPSGTPLTASLVYVGIYFLSRTPPFPRARFPLDPDRSMGFEANGPHIRVSHIELPLPPL